jgi:hypothetical protein
MPNLKVHLEVARNVCDELNINGKDRELILFGSILPDINTRDIIDNIKEYREHSLTHFEIGKARKDLVFLKKYEEYLNNNKIVLGYYIHLFTDVYWTGDFFNRIDNTNLNELSFEEKTKIKQYDFQIKDNSYKYNYLNISQDNIDEILEASKVIEEVKVSREEVTEIIEFSKKFENFDGEYKIYTEEILDDLMNKTVNVLKNKIYLNLKECVK